MERTQLDVDKSDDIPDSQPPAEDVIRCLDSFNRRYDYHIDSCWQLPSPNKLFGDDFAAWQDNELMSLKSQLNDVKGRLSNVDIVTWHNHTQASWGVPKLRNAGVHKCGSHRY